MPRDIYGNSLPPVEDSRDSDIFHNIVTNQNFVFDNGEWNELPQDPSGDLPAPTIADAGKAIVVGEDGKYELGEASGGDPGYDVTTETEVLLAPGERSWGEVSGAWVATGNVSEGFNDGDTIRFTIDSHVYEYVAESKNINGQTICFAGEFNPEESVLGPCVLSLENGETGPFLQFLNPTEPSNEITSAEKVITTVTVTDDFALARGYNISKSDIYVECDSPQDYSANRFALGDYTSPLIGETVLVNVNGTEELFTVDTNDTGLPVISSPDKFTITFNDEHATIPNEAVYKKYSEGVVPTYVKVSNYEVFVTDDFKDAVTASGSATGGAFLVHVNQGDFDKTYEEVVAAINSTQIVQIIEGSATGGAGDAIYIHYVTSAYELGGVYVVQTTEDGHYSTESADDYPHVSDS